MFLNSIDRQIIIIYYFLLLRDTLHIDTFILFYCIQVERIRTVAL
jgi:hypothetical protein